jgi:hypothetical protein
MASRQRGRRCGEQGWWLGQGEGAYRKREIGKEFSLIYYFIHLITYP